MRIEAPKKLFTVEEYYKMADAGIFAPEDRVELIDGEIIQMSPIGIRHAGCVNGATQVFVRYSCHDLSSIFIRPISVLLRLRPNK